MTKRIVGWMVVPVVCLGLAGAPAALAADGPRETELLLELLVKKGVVTQAEARELLARTRELAARPGTGHEAETRTVAGEAGPAQGPVAGPPRALEGLSVGMLAYLSYQDGTRYEGVPGTTGDYSKFTIKRGYLNIKKKITPHLEARITPDLHQDATGDWKARFKYVYGKFTLEGSGLVQKPYVEFGLIHMPWLDFEEHINRFRMQDTMFMERSGLFNSADAGVMFGANLGPELPEEYRHRVNHHYAGRHGSFQVGVYNGGGYHAAEHNTNKVLEGRLSLRPLPDAAPGFQVSVFGLTGKGNTEAEPDWDVAAAMLSWESPRLVLTGQYVTASGNQKGSAVDASGRALDRNGWSLFGEYRFGEARDWSVIGRYETFDPDTDDPASDETTRWIGGLAWQFATGNYWLLDYQRVEHDHPQIPDEHRLQLTLQVKY